MIEVHWERYFVVELSALFYMTIISKNATLWPYKLTHHLANSSSGCGMCMLMTQMSPPSTVSTVLAVVMERAPNQMAAALWPQWILTVLKSLGSKRFTKTRKHGDAKQLKVVAPAHFYPQLTVILHYRLYSVPGFILWSTNWSCFNSYGCHVMPR